MEGVDDFGRNTTAGRDFVTAATGPFANCRTLFAINRGATASRTPGTPSPPATHTTSGLDPLLQIFAEFLRIPG